MKLTLHTVAIREDGCFSVLLDDTGRPFAVTVERTFDGNRVVIGSGIHRCVRTHFQRGNYPTFEIEVPGHSRVLFHRGNVETDSLGCVIVGESFGELNGKTAVLDSRGGFGEFWSVVQNEQEFLLEVTGEPRGI